MQQAELIVAYLQGELTGQQAQDFEQRLAIDADLQSAVKDYQIILEGFKGIKHEGFLGETTAWSLQATPNEADPHILAYLEGRLSETEKNLLEQRIASEPELAQTVAAYREIMEGFKGIRQDDFAAEVREWAKALPTAVAVPEARVVAISKKGMNWWRYAAAAALLIAAGIWVLSSLGSSDNSLTAFRQENYIEPAPDALVRGGEEVLGEAGRSFARKDYSAAAEALEVIPAADSLFIAARYLQGHSYYQMGEYQQAVVAFSKCLDPPQGVNYDLRDFNRDNAAWTRILAQLALMEQDQDPLIRQDLRNYFSDFMQTADRSDTYYTRGLELEKWIVE